MQFNHKRVILPFYINSGRLIIPVMVNKLEFAHHFNIYIIYRRSLVHPINNIIDAFCSLTEGKGMPKAERLAGVAQQSTQVHASH